MTAINRSVPATYYSLAAVGDSAVLLARWINDETGASGWLAIDKEPYGESHERAWAALKTRNSHLLNMG